MANPDRKPTLVPRAAVTALALGLLALAAAPSLAEADGHRALRVMVDKAQVVPLSGQATVVLVANPAIADVVVERDHLLFVLGKRPGETRLYIYGANGRPLLERDIIVVPLNDHAVTVFRDTLTTNYSCDDRCVAINTQAGPAAPGAGAAGLTGQAPGTPAPPPPAPAPAVSAGATAVR
jgi:pilus assembly protein CpaC